MCEACQCNGRQLKNLTRVTTSSVHTPSTATNGTRYFSRTRGEWRGGEERGGEGREGEEREGKVRVGEGRKGQTRGGGSRGEMSSPRRCTTKVPTITAVRASIATRAPTTIMSRTPVPAWQRISQHSSSPPHPLSPPAPTLLARLTPSLPDFAFLPPSLPFLSCFPILTEPLTHPLLLPLPTVSPLPPPAFPVSLTPHLGSCTRRTRSSPSSTRGLGRAAGWR